MRGEHHCLLWRSLVRPPFNRRRTDVVLLKPIKPAVLLRGVGPPHVVDRGLLHHIDGGAALQLPEPVLVSIRGESPVIDVG